MYCFEAQSSDHYVLAGFSIHIPIIVDPGRLRHNPVTKRPVTRTQAPVARYNGLVSS